MKGRHSPPSYAIEQFLGASGRGHRIADSALNWIFARCFKCFRKETKSITSSKQRYIHKKFNHLPGLFYVCFLLPHPHAFFKCPAGKMYAVFESRIFIRTAGRIVPWFCFFHDPQAKHPNRITLFRQSLSGSAR